MFSIFFEQQLCLAIGLALDRLFSMFSRLPKTFNAKGSPKMKRFGISILFLVTAVAITGCFSERRSTPVSGTSTASTNPIS